VSACFHETVFYVSCAVQRFVGSLNKYINESANEKMPSVVMQECFVTGSHAVR